MPYLIALFIIVLILFVWWIATHNRFKRLLVKIDEASSGIDVALTKRFDTLSKLRDIAKSYAKHEVDTFDKIVQLRKGMTVSEKNNANIQLDQMQKQINVVAESYPELKSSENFKQLQLAVMDVEEHLQASRRLYNANVSLFNQLAASFPSSIVSNSMKLKQQAFFMSEESRRQDVAMNL